MKKSEVSEKCSQEYINVNATCFYLSQRTFQRKAVTITLACTQSSRVHRQYDYLRLELVLDQPMNGSLCHHQRPFSRPVHLAATDSHFHVIGCPTQLAQSYPVDTEELVAVDTQELVEAQQIVYNNIPDTFCDQYERGGIGHNDETHDEARDPIGTQVVKEPRLHANAFRRINISQSQRDSWTSPEMSRMDSVEGDLNHFGIRAAEA
nr:hypothetical protein CFP56_30674 [Quercus suber]